MGGVTDTLRLNLPDYNPGQGFLFCPNVYGLHCKNSGVSGPNRDEKVGMFLHYKPQ